MSSIPEWFVIIMGIGTVFVGLVCIILLCKLLSVFCSYCNLNQEPEKKQQAKLPAVQAQQAAPVSANRQEIIAAIGAVIAEECGVDVNGIRILSIKRI